jgi:hypothetical protein
MRPVYLSTNELCAIRNALAVGLAAHLREFDQAYRHSDLLSQRRAVRAAKEARRLDKLMARVDEHLSKSLG